VAVCADIFVSMASKTSVLIVCAEICMCCVCVWCVRDARFDSVGILLSVDGGLCCDLSGIYLYAVGDVRFDCLCGNLNVICLYGVGDVSFDCLCGYLIVILFVWRRRRPF
jgi:hypothetical protein